MKYKNRKEEHNMKNVSNGFQLFLEESNGVGKSWMDSIMNTSKVSALDAKTQELAYIAVLAALQEEGGLPFHVKHAKELGATLEEVKSAVLVGMPLIGIRAVGTFAAAINSYQ